MICFECGKEAQHRHHVVPRSRGGTQTVPLCYSCHGLAHGIYQNHPQLIKEGLARARAAGKRPGRPQKVFPWMVDQAMEAKAQGLSYKKTAARLGVSHVTLTAAVWRRRNKT